MLVRELLILILLGISLCVVFFASILFIVGGYYELDGIERIVVMLIGFLFLGTAIFLLLLCIPATREPIRAFLNTEVG